MKRLVRRFVISLVGPLLAIGCASFGKFAPGAKDAVAETCKVLDSGNPAIGAACLTAEEIVSVLSHVKAARAYRAHRLGAAPGSAVDICGATP